MQSTTQAALDTTHTQPLAEASQPGRLVSLDVFRGITVMAMILVNNPGDWGHIYAPLEHAAWHGCTPTDLIFPFFLFIVGVSLVYALDGLKRQGGPLGATMLRVVRRGAVLFALGLLLALFPKFEFATVRIPGVLQRIGLVFIFSSAVFLYTGRRTQLGLLAGILVLYNVLLQLVPAPGLGAATLLPGHDLGAWLDRTLLSEAHLWKSSKTWDPEGLLSTLPAVGTGLLGVLTAQWLRRREVPPAEKVAWLFVHGALLIVLGLIWNGWFPINKSLWTSSYVLYTGGIAISALAVLYWLCDVQGWRGWIKPFLVYGVNAITVFFLSGLIPRILGLIKQPLPGSGKAVGLKEWLYQTVFVPAFEVPENASLAGAVTLILIWLGILWWMYHKRIIIKV
ncbi:acyltransferase family protein [Hymenobacter latericus]|uniref:acyltransferase family protein n=1 Tax=Hymenobacter sp. YIM 151858-1 TaxID=2987688 RepID=UPI00222790FA|nr:heparan-alpha-glucosaminide N-acetyltransferase domain-containing protein [Hymenobacter sp. YIM 151858-1]UYZ59389.1 heparan-alpha-glucosaminide N-acetyltransferase domain-containing protein [Hymenobacter sp. YIM 151858-1]